MKKLSLSFVILGILALQSVFAQTPEQMHETGKAFIRQGDYANAILVLKRTAEQRPENIEVSKDLSQAYFFQGNNVKALEVISPLLESDKADDQVFQVAANIYKQVQQPKEAEKIYKKGLKRFPASGPLYNELGEIQFIDKDYKDAIKNWEKGIETDPSYSKNYYNAARYYYLTTDKVWSILYGEIFVNMEPTGTRAAETKQVLLESYKKFFADPNSGSEAKSTNVFMTRFLEIMNRQSAAASAGITTESLSVIRTRFIIDWYAAPAAPAFRLFEHHRQLLKEGMFEAYNQWLFGPAENLSAYENWTKTHAAENNSFLAFQKARMFKIPAGQYYH